MATGNATRFAEIGVAPRLARELATQITAGVGNFRRLAEVGMVPGAAKLVASVISGGSVNNNRLAEASLVPRFIRELKAQAGGGVAPVVPWWSQAAVIDLDFQNSRFYVNGTEYTSLAAMVAAGAYTGNATYGELTLSGISLGASYSVYSEATTSASTAGAGGQWLWQLKETGTGSNNSVGMSRNSTDNASRVEAVNNAGTTVASISTTAVANSTALTWATRVRYGTAGVALSSQSAAVVLATPSGGYLFPTYTKLVVGNRNAADRPWGGTIKRIVILNDLSNTELIALAANINTDPGTRIYQAIIEPFQMEPCIATQRDGFIQVGMVNNLGEGRVAEIDITKRRSYRTAFVYDWAGADEHRTVAVKHLSDGKLLAVAAPHSSSSLIPFAKSTTSRGFGLPKATAVSSGLTQPNYMSIVQGSVDIFQVTNDDALGGTFARPAVVFMRSTDGGATFNRCRAVTGRALNSGDVTNQLYQHVAQPSTDVVLLYTVLHDDNANAVFRLLEVNLLSGDVITRDSAGTATVQGNMFTDTTNTTPITNFDILPIPWALTAGRKQIELVMKDDGSMIAVQDVPNAGPSNGATSVVNLQRLTGANPFNPAHWTASVLPFSTTFTDMAFSREAGLSGLRMTITDAQGAMPYRLVRYDNSQTDGQGMWTTTVLMQDALELRRPFYAVNDNIFGPMCVRFRYRNSFSDYDADLVWPA